MALNVVIENSVLRGLGDDHDCQRVATVYIDGETYHVCAPAKLTGDAFEFVEHFSVRQPSKDALDWGAEFIITDQRRGTILTAVAQELQQRKLSEDIWQFGVHPDARYYAAQICLRGHVQFSNKEANAIKKGEYCPQCGDEIIHACIRCKAPIRGQDLLLKSDYVRPSFCYHCGRPYPWMEERLRTAKELLDHDEKMTLDERKELWDLLQYMMSDPKSDLVPAKKTLIGIKLAEAAAVTRDFVTDLIAKYAAEMSKP